MSRKRNHRMSPERRAQQQAAVREIRFVPVQDRAALNQPHDEATVTGLMNDTRLALVRMLEGTAEDRHMRRLGTDLNSCWIRAEQIEGGELVQRDLEAAAAALEEAKRIHRDHGRYGLTGPGRIALGQGVDAIELVLRASSPLQMHAAEETLSASLRALQRRKSRTA